MGDLYRALGQGEKAREAIEQNERWGYSERLGGCRSRIVPRLPRTTWRWSSEHMGDLYRALG